MVLGTWSREGQALSRRATAFSATATWPSSSAPRSSVCRKASMPVAAPRSGRPLPSSPSRPRLLWRISPKAASSSARTRPSCRSRAGKRVPVTYGDTPLKADGTMMGKRLAALIELRDHARRVLQIAERGLAGRAPAGQARRALNRALRPLRRHLRPHQQDDLLDHRRRQRDPPHAEPGQVPRGSRRHAGHVAGGLRRGDRQGRPRPPS